MEFMYQVKGVPADKVSFSMLDEKLIIEFSELAGDISRMQYFDP